MDYLQSLLDQAPRFLSTLSQPSFKISIALAVLVWLIWAYSSLLRELRRLRMEIEDLKTDRREANPAPKIPSDRFLAPTMAADADPRLPAAVGPEVTQPKQKLTPDVELVDYVFNESDSPKAPSRPPTPRPPAKPASSRPATPPKAPAKPRDEEKTDFASSRGPLEDPLPLNEEKLEAFDFDEAFAGSMDESSADDAPTLIKSFDPKKPRKS